MNYGKAFRDLREEQNLSRKELATQIGCTPSSLSKIERGIVIPKHGTIQALCAICRCPVARFYFDALEPSDFGSIEPIR